MSRSYRGVRPKTHRVYSVQDVLTLYDISRNTVCNWVRGGLVPVDKQKPQLFRGAELARFHADRRQERPKLRSGEFKCLGCKAVLFPETTTVCFQTSSKGEMFANATCPDCGASLMKRLGKTEYDSIRNCLDTNTSLNSIDEELGARPACIGTNQAKPAQTQPSPNDRLIRDWQDYAGRYTEKTVDAHLAAIRSFEAFIQLKSFSKVTTDDAAAWREDVVSSGGGGLSHSTIRHRASHLRAFFEWLGKEAGFRHLAPVPAYFELPRRFHQKKVSKSREYPTLDEAEEILDAMPTKTLKDRRQRAIFAFAFLGGLRADALITVRRRHVDLARRQITHDGEEMRTKNGKSFVVNWFPRTEHFRQVFIAWFEEGTALGLQPDDALFPDLASLSSARRRKKDPIAPMKTIGAVSEAFKIASKNRATAYSPHSARHTLVQLGDQICRTAEARKAWSLNLGHASEEVTWRYYGKVDDGRKREIFEVFEAAEPSTSDELELMLAYHEHKLMRGTPEFEQAEVLVFARQQERRWNDQR